MNRLFLALAVASAVFAADQLSKYGVLTGLDLASVGRIEVAPFLNFVLAYNYGVNFGLFASNSPWAAGALAALAGAVSLALFYWAARTASDGVTIGCGLVAGGALGNGFDRLWNGAVVDFLNVDCCGIGNPYAFNIADAGIFLGALLIAYCAWSTGDEGPDAADRPG